MPNYNYGAPVSARVQHARASIVSEFSSWVSAVCSKSPRWGSKVTLLDTIFTFVTCTHLETALFGLSCGAIQVQMSLLFFSLFSNHYKSNQQHPNQICFALKHSPQRCGAPGHDLLGPHLKLPLFWRRDEQLYRRGFLSVFESVSECV